MYRTMSGNMATATTILKVSRTLPTIEFLRMLGSHLRIITRIRAGASETICNARVRRADFLFVRAGQAQDGFDARALGNFTRSAGAAFQPVMEVLNFYAVLDGDVHDRD